MFKLSFSNILLTVLLLIVVGQYFLYKRDVNSLKEELSSTLNRERDQIVVQVDSILSLQKTQIQERLQEIESNTEQLSKIKEVNNTLNRKIKFYEKNLDYSNRDLDDALNVFSEYKYNTGAEK